MHGTFCSEGNIFLEIGTLTAVTYYPTPKPRLFMSTGATRHADQRVMIEEAHARSRTHVIIHVLAGQRE